MVASQSHCVCLQSKTQKPIGLRVKPTEIRNSYKQNNSNDIMSLLVQETDTSFKFFFEFFEIY